MVSLLPHRGSPSDPLSVLSRLPPPRLYALVALGCLLAKLALWAFDHGVLLHSDSGNYVRDAYTMRPAWPRPIGYAVFLRVIFELPVFELSISRLSGTVGAQTLLGAALGVATFAFAERLLGASRGWSLVAAVVVTLSPLALVLERYILADVLGVAALAAALAALLVFVRRPSGPSALLFGIAAVLPQMVRAAWAFLPLLLVALALVAVTDRPRDGRRRAVALTGLAGVLTLLLTVGYAWFFSAYNLGQTDLAAAGSGFAGWTLWGSVARFAEPDDLDGFPYADVLMSDPESLARNGSFQIWDFDSTANRLRRERFDDSFVRTNPVLLRAGLRVAVRHPLAVAGQLGGALLCFFRPVLGNNDYSRVIEVDARSIGHIEWLLGPEAIPSPRRPPRIGPALRLWRWLRWLWSGALFVALAVGLARPRRRFPVLAVGAVGVAYLLVVNLAIGFVFVERYFLPVEYLGVLATVALAAVFSDGSSTVSRAVP